LGPLTRTLLLANAAVFTLQLFVGEWLVAHFALWPLGRHDLPEFHMTVAFQPWQLITSSFLHGNLTHLLLNMFALFMFGRDLEAILGRRKYAALYFGAVLSASLVQLAVVSFLRPGPPTATLGASGGVFGLLLAFGMLFPRRTVTLLFPPIPMPAWLFVSLYGLLELTNGIFRTESGVAHFAHLGGMLGAFVLLRLWRTRGGGDGTSVM
jgi:membrane associated rhomboid family serine protease